MSTTSSSSCPTSLAAPTLLALLLACATPPGEGDVPTSPEPGRPHIPKGMEPKPWTASFRTPALIVADEVRIEGPAGLLNHVATKLEPDHHTYEAETVPEGFRQVFEPRDPETGMEMTVYLDAYRIAALRRLVLLERPGDVAVVIEAVGDAWWRDTETGAEKRGSRLVFRGAPPE